MDVRISEDGPAGHPDGVEVLPEGVADLSCVSPELVVVHKPLVYLLSPEYVGVLVELVPQPAGQLITDVVAGDAVSRGGCDCEDDDGDGEDQVTLDDGFVHCQQLLGSGHVS